MHRAVDWLKYTGFMRDSEDEKFKYFQSRLKIHLSITVRRHCTLILKFVPK